MERFCDCGAVIHGRPTKIYCSTNCRLAAFQKRHQPVDVQERVKELEYANRQLMERAERYWRAASPQFRHFMGRVDQVYPLVTA